MDKFSGLPAFIFILTMLVAGCHEKEPFDGPSLVDQFGPFELRDSLRADRDSVDFAMGESVVFTASFNKNVDWTLTITGQTTGSQKIIEGFSNELDMTNARWNGTTSVLPLFTAEPCTAVLTIADEPDIALTTEVVAQSGRQYEGSLFTDFETDQSAFISLGNFEFELSPRTGRQDDMPAGQGQYYWLWEGTDNVVTNFFVGLADISAPITGEQFVPLPTTVPEDLYFNAFLYSDGTPNTIAVIQFATDSNGNGVFDPEVDVNYQLPGDFPINWTGWRQISHSMAEIGISQAELEELVGIRMLLISNNTLQPSPPLQVSYGIDYMIFTQNGPLQP